ncbi:hypothetical protein QEN19_003789 [Hanseniaspora menglaensis]
MPSYNSDNIPQEINKVLTSSNKYEELETKLVNQLLTTSNVIAILKKKCQDALIKNNSLSIEQLIESLQIKSSADILSLDSNTSESEIRQNLKEFLVKELENILY